MNKVLPLILAIGLISLSIVYFVSAISFYSNASKKMIAYLPFEDSLIDVTDNGNDGTLVFSSTATDGDKISTYLPGKNGKALNFNGKIAVALPNSAKVSTLRNFTIMAWIKPNSSINGSIGGYVYTPVISELNAATPDTQRYVLGHQESIVKGSVILMLKYKVPSGAFSTVGYGTNAVFNRWSHITAVVNRDENNGVGGVTVYVYLNGQHFKAQGAGQI